MEPNMYNVHIQYIVYAGSNINIGFSSKLYKHELHRQHCICYNHI